MGCRSCVRNLCSWLLFEFSCNDGFVASKVGLLTEFRASDVSGEVKFLCACFHVAKVLILYK